MRKHGKSRDKICNDKEPLEPTESNAASAMEQLTNVLSETSIKQQPVVSTSISSFEQTQSPTRSASSPDSEAGPSSSLGENVAIGSAGKKKNVPFLSSISSSIHESTNLTVPSTSQCPNRPKQVFVRETDSSRPKPTSRKKYSSQSAIDAEKDIQVGFWQLKFSY